MDSKAKKAIAGLATGFGVTKGGQARRKRRRAKRKQRRKDRRGERTLSDSTFSRAQELQEQYLGSPGTVSLEQLGIDRIKGQGARNSAIDQIGRAGAQFAGAQSQLISQFQNQIAGNGPSVAQNQLKSGLNQALRQQGAMAMSGRGNTSLNMRNAMLNAGAMQGQVNEQAATLRASEQLGAMNSLGGVIDSAQNFELNRAGMLSDHRSRALQQDFDQNLASASFQREGQLQNAGLLMEIAQYRAGNSQSRADKAGGRPI